MPTAPLRSLRLARAASRTYKDGLRIGELTPYHGAGLTRWSEPGCDRLFGRFWQDPGSIDAITDLSRAIRESAPLDPSPWIRHDPKGVLA